MVTAISESPGAASESRRFRAPCALFKMKRSLVKRRRGQSRRGKCTTPAQCAASAGKTRGRIGSLGAKRRHQRHAAVAARGRLLAEAEALDEREVALAVGRSEVLQQAVALADEKEEATTRRVILLVGLEVVLEFRDAGGDRRDLHFGGSGVLRVVTAGFDDGVAHMVS